MAGQWVIGFSESGKFIHEWIKVTLAVSLSHDLKMSNNQLYNSKNNYILCFRKLLVLSNVKIILGPIEIHIDS